MDFKSEDLADLEEATLEIAKKKIVPSIILDSEGEPLMRMGTGGRFDNFFSGTLRSLLYGVAIFLTLYQLKIL